MLPRRNAAQMQRLTSIGEKLTMRQFLPNKIMQTRKKFKKIYKIGNIKQTYETFSSNYCEGTTGT
jgi:hypothetical protein